MSTANENAVWSRVRRGADPNAACSAKAVHPGQTNRRSYLESRGCWFHRSVIHGRERTAASITGGCSGHLHCHANQPPEERFTGPQSRRYRFWDSGVKPFPNAARSCCERFGMGRWPRVPKKKFDLISESSLTASRDHGVVAQNSKGSTKG